MLVLISTPGCKVVWSFGIHKDWVVDSYANPDLRTKVEVRLEEDYE